MVRDGTAAPGTVMWYNREAADGTDVASAIDSICKTYVERVVKRGAGGAYLELGHPVDGQVELRCFRLTFNGQQERRAVRAWKMLARVRILVSNPTTPLTTMGAEWYSWCKQSGFFKKRHEVSQAVDDVCAAVAYLRGRPCPRGATNIGADSSGKLAGSAWWIPPGGSDMQSLEQWVGIPGHVADIEAAQFDVGTAKAIIIVESNAAFDTLVQGRIFEQLPCILVSGGGQPALATRALVARLANEFELPVIGYFDFNAAGVAIAAAYKYGSRSVSLHGHQCDRLQLAGLSAKHVEERVPGTKVFTITAKEVAAIASQESRAPYADDVELSRALSELRIRGGKAELEAVDELLAYVVATTTTLVG